MNKNGTSMCAAVHALTIDVEEWFHICGAEDGLSPLNCSALPSRVVPTTMALLELLDRYGIRATFFVLGYVADRYPELIQFILNGHHEIGTHGHQHRRVYDLTPSEFQRDLDLSLTALRACGVRDIAGFRAPEWSINDRSMWALDVVASRQIRIDSSMAPLRVVGNPRFPQTVHRRQTVYGDIVECPPAVCRRFGQNIPEGGGWGLRMRRPVVILRALESRLAAGRPAVLWIHPWELDDDPPRTRLPAAQRFAHYFCLSGFRQRLETVLRGSVFGPLGNLVRDVSPS